MRYDKYEPYSGGFRAPLNADVAATSGAVGDATAAIGVGLNSSGKVVKGAGNTGVKGVLCLTGAAKANDIVDIMTDGEIVEFGGTPGTAYYAAADGTISTTNTGTYIGHTVEGGRLVVRVAR